MPSTLRGRLVSGNRRSRFDGESGVVRLLSRFFVVQQSAVETPAELAAELAWRAQRLKRSQIEELGHESTRGGGPLKTLFDIFNEALVTLDVEIRGRLRADLHPVCWLRAGSTPTGKNSCSRAGRSPELLPSTSAFLHDLFRKLVTANFGKNLVAARRHQSLLARTSVAQGVPRREGSLDPFLPGLPQRIRPRPSARNWASTTRLTSRLVYGADGPRARAEDGLRPAVGPRR